MDELNTISTFLWPGRTHFGFGAAGLVAQAAQTERAERVFVLADPGVVAAGLVAPIEETLAEAGLEPVLYAQVTPNPDVASVDEAGRAFRESGADLIVAVGGGSGLDTAKGVQLLGGAPAGASIAEFALILGDEMRPIPPQLPPLIAIPTTAGTGSEVTPWGVITDHARQRKVGIGGHYLIPTVALVDPELTLTLPAPLTAATGLDALSHLIEAYVSTNDVPALGPMILHGIELIGRSLRVAVARPGNRAARRDVMLASMIGGIAISSRWLGACHSLAHPLSSLADLHHGVAIALMLPHQMKYSLIGALEQYAAIGQALDPAFVRAGSRRMRAERAVELVRELIADVGLPTRLRDAGVAEDLIEPLAASAYVDLNWATNPRTVSEAVMEDLYRAAY